MRTQPGQAGQQRSGGAKNDTCVHVSCGAEDDCYDKLTSRLPIATADLGSELLQRTHVEATLVAEGR